ncbi:MAG: metal ABC transporter substrate-binding protein [Methanoregula sp.]|nr:metal ABC transporter substrate-binding protein [Methanoregula sp.]
MKKFGLLILCVVLLGFLVLPVSAELKIVTTTSVLADPLEEIGGANVTVVTVSDPGLCPNMQADVIANIVQMKQDFIKSADMYAAHNGSIDKNDIMPVVNKFMAANNFGNVTWQTPKNPNQDWNTPASALQLVAEEKSWLIKADPANASYYEARYADYIQKIAAQNLTVDEKQKISGQDVVVMVWQQNAARDWLGLNVVSVFAPEFYQGGNYTPAKVVDDINAHPEKYRDVRYVIENMQSGEMAKGIEEALHAQGINATRVVFTNFPKSVSGVDSIPEVLAYNKGLVTPQGSTGAVPATTQSPLGSGIIIVGICAAGVARCLRRH